MKDTYTVSEKMARNGHKMAIYNCHSLRLRLLLIHTKYSKYDPVFPGGYFGWGNTSEGAKVNFFQFLGVVQGRCPKIIDFRFQANF